MRTVLAVDGGNSKTDVALLDDRGRLLVAARGGSTSHQAVGLEPGMERLAGLVADVQSAAGLTVGEPADLGVYGLAGADSPSDVRLLTRAIAGRGLARRDEVRNDTMIALRAGTDRGWGIVLICGSGVNAAGLGPDGRFARLAALGTISGDWGGGSDVGRAGLGAAVRARDGRGPRTRLERDVPEHFGLSSPNAVTMALYRGRIRERRLGELAPVVFAVAAAGDPVARTIVDRLADELVVMASAMLRRTGLTRFDAEIVLAGGVFRTDDLEFYRRLEAGIRAVAPRARLVRSDSPPVAGAALLGLDALGADDRTLAVDPAAVRSVLRDWDRDQQPRRGER